MAQRRRKPRNIPVDPKKLEARPVRAPLWEDIKIFGVGALMCLAAIIGSAPQYLEVTSAAKTVASDLAKLPEAKGQPPGTRAILSGLIAPDTKPLFRHFVAYHKEEYRKGGRTGHVSWKAVGGMIQPLRLLDGSQESWIENDTYAFSPEVRGFIFGFDEPVLPIWDHMDVRDGDEPGGPIDRLRYRGFAAGRAVTAIGTVTRDGSFHAENVVAGTRDEVIATLQKIASGETESVAFWFAIAGSLALSVISGLFFYWRSARW
jgi:hypothetical protein